MVIAKPHSSGECGFAHNSNESFGVKKEGAIKRFPNDCTLRVIHGKVGSELFHGYFLLSDDVNTLLQ